MSPLSISVYNSKILDIMQVTNYNNQKTCINTIRRCLKYLDHTIFNSLQIAITKKHVSTLQGGVI